MLQRVMAAGSYTARIPGPPKIVNRSVTMRFLAWLGTGIRQSVLPAKVEFPTISGGVS